MQFSIGGISQKLLSSLLSPVTEERLLVLLLSLATGVQGSIRLEEMLYLPLVGAVI